MAIFSVVRKQNDIDSLQTYKTFDGLKPLQTAVKAYKNMIEESDSITKSMKDKLTRLLDYLRKHSLKVCGVSWISQSKIAKALGVSKRQTIGKWIAILEELGFIKRLKAKRSSDNRRTTDLIVIQPLPIKESGHKEVPENGHKDVEKKGQQEKLLSLKSSSLKSFKRNEDVPFDANAVHTEIPKDFVEKVATRFNNASIIEELWSRFELAFKNNYKADTQETPKLHSKDAANIVLAVTKSAKEGKLKKGNDMNAIYGAVYGLAAKLSKKWHAKHVAKYGLANSNIPYFDWLTN